LIRQGRKRKERKKGRNEGKREREKEREYKRQQKLKSSWTHDDFNIPKIYSRTFEVIQWYTLTFNYQFDIYIFGTRIYCTDIQVNLKYLDMKFKATQFHKL